MAIMDRRQKKISTDAKAAVKWLNEKVSNKQIILYGESLGTGVGKIAQKDKFNSNFRIPFTSIENSAKFTILIYL